MSRIEPSSFEAGFPKVVAASHAGRPMAAIGRRKGVVRVEWPDERALQFDDEGRLINAQRSGLSYRRTLDHRLLVTRNLGRGATHRQRREAPPEDPLGRIARWQGEAGSLLDPALELSVVRGEIDEPTPWLQEALGPVARWTRDALESELARLRAIYRPIPILPPDQYASLVLQATEGCSYNRCGFCDFYRGVPYRVRPVAEFAEHVDSVLALLGKTVSRYRRVFLGQANAMLVDTDHLLAILVELRRRLPVRATGMGRPGRTRWESDHPLWIDGVYSFVDGFHEAKSVDELAALRDAGLRRVYLGLESGSRKVLKLLRKPGAPESPLELARRLKSAGVALGVILLVGAGGRENEALHVEESLAAVRSMGLGRGDQLYLSRLVVHEGSDYEAQARARGLTPLNAADLHRQADRLTRELRRQLPAAVPVAPYDLRISRSVLPSF